MWSSIIGPDLAHEAGYQSWLQRQVDAKIIGQYTDPDGVTRYTYDPTGEGDQWRRTGNNASGEEQLRAFYDQHFTPDAKGNLPFGTAGRDFNQPVQEFQQNGKTYLPIGFGDATTAYGEQDAALRKMGIDPAQINSLLTYDPEHGYGLPVDAVQALNKGSTAHNADWSDMLPVAFGLAATGGVALSGGALGAGAEGLASGSQVPASYWNMLAGDIPDGGISLSQVNPSMFSNLYEAASSGAMTPAGTAALQSSIDPIQALAALDEAGGGSGAMAGAKALGFPSVEAALSSVSPSFLSSGLSLSSLLGNPAALRTLLSAGTGLIGANTASNAATNAARIQAGAAGDANSLLAQMYNQNRADLQPWREAGGLSLATLGQKLGISGDPNATDYGSLLKSFSSADLAADPIYGAARDFQLSETDRALKNAASSRGELDSGVLLKDLLKYGTGVLTSTGNDAYNRFQGNRTTTANLLSGVSGTGQTTATQIANAGQNAVTQQAANLTSAGAATAAGQVGSANAFTSGLNNVAQQYTTQDLLDRFLPFLKTRSTVGAE